MNTNDPYYATWDEVPDPVKKEEGQSSDSDPSIPDGEHNCRIEAFRCWESKAGDFWIKFILSVLDGLFAGRTLVRMVAPLGRRQDAKEKQLKWARWAKEDLFLLLGEVPNIWDIINPETRPAIAAQVVGAVVKVQKSTKVSDDGDDWINVYLNDLLSPAPTSQSDTDDDVPPFPTDDDAPVLPRGGFGIADPEEEEIPY